MKNIYTDNNPHEKNPSDKKEDVQGTYPAEQPPYGQPVYVQPPYGQPVYYIPVGQPPYGQTGYPVPPVPLTQEQFEAIYRQYGAQFPFPQQQFAQPQNQPEGEASQIDPGTRVLFQSADFDAPSDPRTNYEDDINEETEDIPVKASPKKAEPRKPIPGKSSMADPIEIEEETVSLPSKESAPKKNSFRVEEMEMSTYELNSILLRKGHSTAAYPHHTPDQSKDVPLDFSGTFNIDEGDEDIEDISSNVEKPDTNKKPEKSKEGKKKLPASEIVRRCVLAVAVIAIVISAAMLLNEFLLSRENNKLEEGVSDLILTEPTTADPNLTTTKKKDKDKTTTAALTPEQQWAQIQKEYPNIIFPMGLQLKYARLYATNPDFVGYLEAKGINLSLPIVQTNNDTDYMRKNFYGKSTKYGCPFVTHVNNIVDLDTNTIIFGHHMNNGTVFGALDAYKKIDGFKAAPVISFNTMYRDYSWKVVAAFITNAYEKDDNGYIFRYYFASLSTQDRFAVYLNEMSQRSLYDTGVDVLPTDKLLTLSTCSHEFEDARFVVVARLVRPGESTDVDVSKATVNPNPRYPQAYYSKKKLDNPYANASRWEVG